MEEMMEQAIPHVKYYMLFGYNHGGIQGEGCVNLNDVDRMSVDFFKNNIQHSYEDNTNYYIEIVLEYPTTRSTKPYVVTLIKKSLFDYNVDYEQIKDKTIGECVLDVINNLEMDRYNELTTESIKRLKSYLDANFNQLNR